MSSLEPGVAGLIRRRAADAAGSALLRIAETGTVAPATASPAAVANLFLLHPETDWVVVLDEFSRPHELVQRTGGVRVAPLTALATDRLQDVARRVATRRRGERFAPIAVCDELGRLEGLVRVEHLLQALADVADGEEPLDRGTRPAGREAG
jgi:hypothetical protein